MSTTFLNLKTQVSRDVRDPNNATWTTTEIGDLVNAGVALYSRIHPKEAVSAITAGAVSITLPAPLTSLFRVDVYGADGTTFLYVMPPSLDGGPLGGWELHNGVVTFPPAPFQVVPNVKFWGYADYLQLVNDTDVTDLDVDGINLMRAYCQNELFTRLTLDRASFQQWQNQTNATDTSLVWLFRVSGEIQRKFDSERNRLRLIRRKS